MPGTNSGILGSSLSNFIVIDLETSLLLIILKASQTILYQEHPDQCLLELETTPDAYCLCILILGSACCFTYPLLFFSTSGQEGPRVTHPDMPSSRLRSP